MSTYNNLHRQQLFHWIGRHIDQKVPDTKRPLTNLLRLEYLNCLKDVLKNGLWVKTPNDPDYLGDGELIKVSKPIVCFTEWSLGESLPHTTRYGRMGLGFPKRFVLNRGGQPITYVRDARFNDPYTNSLKGIAKYLNLPATKAHLSPKEYESLKAQFDFLAHFNKKIRKPTPPSTRKPSPGNVSPVDTTRIEDPFKRRYGYRLHYLEEREWRIVFHSAINSFFTQNPGKKTVPNMYLPFASGKELYTLVLPDNETVSMAMQDLQIRKKLFPKDGAHVTVLSLQDIGTF